MLYIYNIKQQLIIIIISINGNKTRQTYISINNNNIIIVYLYTEIYKWRQIVISNIFMMIVDSKFV